MEISKNAGKKLAVGIGLRHRNPYVANGQSVPRSGLWAQREAAIESIREVGRRVWQKQSGYRQQARVENGFFRHKSVLGGGLQASNSKTQGREAMIGCHILNRMAALGRPKSYALVS